MGIHSDGDDARSAIVDSYLESDLDDADNEIGSLLGSQMSAQHRSLIQMMKASYAEEEASVISQITVQLKSQRKLSSPGSSLQDPRNG